MLIYFLLLFVI